MEECERMGGGGHTDQISGAWREVEKNGNLTVKGPTHHELRGKIEVDISLFCISSVMLLLASVALCFSVICIKIKKNAFMIDAMPGFFLGI